MDIDDILAEVSGPGTGAGSIANRADDRSPEALDLQALTRAWVNEKCAPELLAWPAALVERVSERLRAQIERIEEQGGSGGGGGGAADDSAANFRLVIVQTELERVKYLIRSLVRTRLAKIDQHGPYYLSLADASSSSSSSSSSSNLPLLSAHERQYAAQHQALLAGHFAASFLAAFPAALQRLDDTAGGISMVDAPDADAAVFVRALADRAGPVVVPGTDIAFDMARGDIYVTRWSAVRQLVAENKAELV